MLAGSNAGKEKKKKKNTLALSLHLNLMSLTSKGYKLNDCQASIPHDRCF